MVQHMQQPVNTLQEGKSMFQNYVEYNTELNTYMKDQRSLKQFERIDEFDSDNE